MDPHWTRGCCAQVVTGMLCEMNSDVVGVPIILNAEETIESITGYKHI